MDSEYKPYSINVYPPIDVINKAFMDVMFFLNWTKAAIIYEEDQGKLYNSSSSIECFSEPIQYVAKQLDSSAPS